jgi:hypothetical protein
MGSPLREPCTMEIEPHTGTFKFLESIIAVKDDVISSQFDLRNYNKEQNRVIKKFLNTQHWGRFNNAPIKRVLVLGTLYRILRFSDPLESAVLPVIADLENGMYYGGNVSAPSNQPLTHEYVTALLKGRVDTMAILGGDATAGSLITMYDGPRPPPSLPRG